ncbi:MULTISPECIES: Na+/H+ antiporter subunit A [unclassified Exiguobacterium]|uniref:Na+/H+ antiporter subunit A n=1 Tax=unclassified Exiguobacterium TaxID=2644629 RepID=UPI00103D6281|nr:MULTISPECIES: Na+/H+ antiporter subunit A [unclassified Exiguobacterium]TCI69649.1 Na+/H+ antiporter subunit A [Exiguobacterium sp. IPCI3]TCI78946.1 Na+/H+ antiporter subunit A [Exiguobacterium sp. IPCH1]TCI81533.1 Na+/H+ antiporter subunit A [Exiguobacterium sp. IPBC4]
MSVLHWVILSPFLFGLIIPLLFKYVPKIHVGWFVWLLPTALFIYFMNRLPAISSGEVVSESVSWIPELGIEFTAYLDGLSMLFVLLITGIGSLVVLYSIFYLSKQERLGNFYLYLMLFMGAMLGVVLSDNLIVLYVFWEVTSIASALLISYWFHKDKSTKGAQKSMLITVAGGLAMLGGFILLFQMTGTFSIREIIANVDAVQASPLFIPAMLLILLGAFTKSAQFPFHIWLPDAMEAPTPVSAYLHSATMVKAGIYLVARMTPVFGGSNVWFWTLSLVGLFTLLWGSISAVRQKDLKGILAFSTVSQLGLIMSLLGVGSAALTDGADDPMYTQAILVAVFHLFNHATFKGALFMAVGIIDHETGTRDIRKLGGLMTVMPITFTVSLIGLASMAGLPPFNGFLSKEKFFTAMLSVRDFEAFDVGSFGIMFPIIAWIASIFTFLYSLIMFFRTFRGKFEPSNYERTVHEAPLGMLISPIILVVLVIVFGLFPNLLSYSIIEPAKQAILPTYLPEGEQFVVNIKLWHGINTELLMTLGVVLVASLLFYVMGRWTKLAIYNRERDPLNWLYDNALTGLTSGSQWITRLQMTGRLRDYFAYIFTFMLLLVGYTFWRFDAFAIDTSNTSVIEPFMWILIPLLMAAVISIPFLNHRITAVIVVGVVGFLLALLLIVFRAPDLALTKLLVETVTLVIFMLAFYHLPELRKEKFTPRLNISNMLISVSVGVMMTLVAFSSMALGNSSGYVSISEYFLENAKELAGGYNVVNVILVDFRGLDTLLEVLVLAVAALGVVTLIKLRLKGGEDV